MKFRDSIFWKIVKNKFFIATAIFLVIIFFIDENNYFVIRSLRKDVNNLNYTIDTLNRGIVNDSIRAESLKTDMVEIERYGRETYFMKGSDEDVFIVNRVAE